MTVKERLLEEFESAINAVLGDNGYKDTDDYNVDSSEINAIAHKVKFYMDLN